MLFITRKVGQEFTIGNSISIKIAGLSKYGIEIGIDAPKELLIQRTKLSDEVKKKGGKAEQRSTYHAD